MVCNRCRSNKYKESSKKIHKNIDFFPAIPSGSRPCSFPGKSNRGQRDLSSQVYQKTRRSIRVSKPRNPSVSAVGSFFVIPRSCGLCSTHYCGLSSSYMPSFFDAFHSLRWPVNIIHGLPVTLNFRGNSMERDPQCNETPNVWVLSSFHPNVSKQPPPTQMFGFCPLFTPTLLSRRARSDVEASTSLPALRNRGQNIGVKRGQNPNIGVFRLLPLNFQSTATVIPTSQTRSFEEEPSSSQCSVSADI